MAAIKQIILLVQRIDGVGGGKESERERDRQTEKTSVQSMDTKKWD